MYPDFKFLLEGLFGIQVPEWVGLFKTFGFFMAMAFLAAAQVTVSELKRKERLGLMLPFLKKTTIEQKNEDGTKTKVTKELLTYPHQIITEIVFAGAIGGILGAKIFNAFETWSDFIQDPIGNFFSPSGLTFYGGLIVATLVIYLYTRTYKIPFKHLCDATAPAIMIAYGIGRLGCQMSGDGDWGIYNTAYLSKPDASLVYVMPQDTANAFSIITRYSEDGTHRELAPHLYFPAPSGVPRWLVAMNYPHNVANEGMRITGSEGDFSNVLPVGVFPTPIYEAFAALLIFCFMWAIRHKLKYPLHMFALYLIFAGVERFLVELIRVNTTIDLGFIKPTQAEVISVILVLIGTFILLTYKKIDAPLVPETDKINE